ncbi:hypothetical protein T4D_6812 [Trichinella pseudospiralis]|uniref:Uncharacterized protein n=1 Tax=Trichinella pseudospiralis TaxID=6337 RepID=A0A0V1FAX1_TRIPS|nr:hypothetical protein T4D_6812 [Trichinella pseudospiralis]
MTVSLPIRHNPLPSSFQRKLKLQAVHTSINAFRAITYGLFHCGGWMEGANFTHFERRNEAFNSHLADEIQKRKKFIMQSFIK